MKTKMHCLITVVGLWGWPFSLFGVDIEPLLVIEPNKENPRNSEGDIIELKDGRWCLVYTRFKGDSGDHAAADLVRRTSDDRGRTWSGDTTVVQHTRGLNVMSVSLLRLASGEIALFYLRKISKEDCRLMTFIRTNAGSQYICYSEDSGETWSKAQPSSLTSPLSPASIKRIPWTGDLLCIWNDHSGRHPYPKGRRTHLCLALSNDEGKTWGRSRIIEDNPDGWYCYTAITFIGNRALLAYCAGDKEVGGLNRLKVMALSRDWLSDDKTN